MWRFATAQGIADAASLAAVAAVKPVPRKPCSPFPSPTVVVFLLVLQFLKHQYGYKLYTSKALFSVSQEKTGRKLSVL